MADSLLRPAEIGPADSERILRFLNAVADTEALAETVGLSDGLAAGRRVAAELIAARPFRSLDQVLAVTGVGLVRFTEIAVALSAARPPLALDTLRFLPVESSLWLGRNVTVTAQLTNPEGKGVLSRQVTCISSDGIVSARSGLQIQAGSAIRLTPEPGGLVRFTYGPRLWPRLDDAARAALSAELSQLDTSARTPDDTARQIATLASRYRGQGAGALQTAIDRLFETYDMQALSPMAPWPVQPVTLLALTHDDAGQILQAASLTLELRNWLGAFYTALTQQVESDTLLPEALKLLAADAEKGRDLSRQIIQATQGYAALERGVLGRRLRDATTGRTVNDFLDIASRTLKGDAIVNTVRAAGASEAAIASGGFAVFEAIRTVQEAGDTIKPPSRVDGLSRDDLLVFDQRLDTLEDSTVSKTDLSRFQRTITADVDQRFDSFEEETVKKSDLDRLRASLTTEFDGRLKSVEDSSLRQTDLDRLRVSLSKEFDAKLKTVDDRQTTEDRFATVDNRLKNVEGSSIRRTDLDRLRAGLSREFDAKLKSVEEGSVTDARLLSLRAEIESDIDKQMETFIARREVDQMIAAVEADMAAKLRTKVNAGTITQLKRTLDKMSAEQTELRTDIGKLKTRTGTTTPRGGVTRG
jgi:hypothetical protein